MPPDSTTTGVEREPFPRKQLIPEIIYKQPRCTTVTTPVPREKVDLGKSPIEVREVP